MATTQVIDVFIIITMASSLLFMLSPKIRNAPFWRATVTPLASIIGSGFLISAPLLWFIMGDYATLTIILVVALAYFVGSAVRFNICHAEPLLATGESRELGRQNRLSDISLSIAYFISIAFYVRLLSSFLLKGLDILDPTSANALTTIILMLNGLYGYFKGFKFLETLEVYTVSIKLSVIAALLIALALYDWKVLDFIPLSTSNPEVTFDAIRKVAGVFLIVQGFETSRYLGHEYSQDLRIKTMKFAQIISMGIYISFIFLVLYVMKSKVSLSETEIINTSHGITHLLAYLIILGAAASQYSASLADTLGCGGLIHELFKKKIPLNLNYLIISGFCIALVWLTNIFELITLASRAFAFYYLTQCISAFYIARYKVPDPNHARQAFFLILSLFMLFIVLFSLPTEGS
ncbi:MAG TPA: hypothetical protein DD412_05885 [Holosporales bacterium]|nr:hypothetical protein [Holosporales bacterium]